MPALLEHKPAEPRNLNRARLSVCLVSDDFSPAATGVGVHVQCLAGKLAALGHCVSVITTRRPGQGAFEIREGVRVHRTFTLKAYGFHQALPSGRALERILAEENPQLVHFHYLGYLLWAAARRAARRGLPRAYTCHMTPEHLTQPLPLRPFRPLVARRIRAFCSGCDLVIAPSRALAERIEHDKVTTKVKYISNPVFFDPGLWPAPDAQRPVPGRFTVLFAGRLAPEKNVGLLLEAFRTLRDQRPGVRLWLAGEGPLRADLQAQVRRLGLQGEAEFLGFLGRTDLARRYAEADCFVLPSLVEAQPMTVLEAMSFGKPVLVTDRIVSARELVDEGRNGFIVGADGGGDLASKLILLHDDRVLRESLGRAGRVKAQAYGVDLFVEATLRAYRDLLGR